MTKHKEQPPTLAEIRENWINGNRKDAVEAILSLPKAAAVAAGIAIAGRLSPDDRNTLGKMLCNRAVED